MVWAYAPWVGDVLQSIPSLVAGEDARGAQNAVWIALIAGMAWTLAGNLKATRSMQWLCVMLVSSLPMLGGLAAGMHTELPATAVLLALFSLIHSELRGRLLFVAILAAGLAGLKLMHIVSAIPILGYLLWLNRGDLRPTNWVPAILVFAVLGLSSYVQSWLDTGNPVLPLFNGYFRSAVAPAVNFDDPRWHAGMSLTLPWDLTFNTTRYLEGGRGALGIVLVALAGSWAVAILRRQFAMPLLLATLALLLPLIVIQYARYALPGLVCMVVIIAVASETIIGKRWASILVVTTSLLNFLVYPSGNWILSTSAITRYVQSNGDESALYIRFLPAMEVLEAIPKNDQGIVLAADPGIPYVARFGKRGRTVSWYDTELNSASRAADMDSSGAAWLAILNNIQPTWLLTNRKHASSGLAVAIIKYGAIKAARCGDAELWHRSEIRNVDSHALTGKEPPDCRATAQ